MIAPHLADAIALWQERGGEGDELAHIAGSIRDEPPSASLREHPLWGRGADGRWRAHPLQGSAAGDRLLAIPLPEARGWLVVERNHGRDPFTSEVIERLRETAVLAMQAHECLQLSERVHEARAIADGAAHRWAMLARVSGRLARSMELEETAEAVLGALVPYLADCVFIDLLHPGGRHQRFARHLNAEEAESGLRYARFPFGGMPVPEAVAALAPEGICVSRWDGRDGFVAEDEAEVVARLAPHSFAVVPVPISGATGGAVTFVSAESLQEYDGTDMDLFRQIAFVVGLGLTAAITLTDARHARREREEVLAMVSHDLKNPLNVLRFATTLLRMPGIPEERRAEQIPVIDRAVSTMDELITNLLDAARIDAGRFSVSPEPTAPEPLVREAITRMTPLAEQKSIRLEADVSAQLPDIAAERGALLRVFGNLISNAISFSAPGSAIQVRARAAVGCVRFEVCDEGQGIDQELLDHIFDRYWQARRQARAGAGLGLTIARGIVLAHGGTMAVDSALGVGTTFHFTVPVASADQTESGSPPRSEDDDGA